MSVCYLRQCHKCCAGIRQLPVSGLYGFKGYYRLLVPVCKMLSGIALHLYVCMIIIIESVRCNCVFRGTVFLFAFHSTMIIFPPDYNVYIKH